MRTTHGNILDVNGENMVYQTNDKECQDFIEEYLAEEKVDLDILKRVVGKLTQDKDESSE